MKKVMVIFLFFCRMALAQQFGYVAPLPVVDSTAFYKIQLLPEIKSKLKAGLADLRLWEANGREVPYLLKNDQELNDVRSFIAFPFLKTTILKDSISQIIIKKDSSRIQSLSLMIRNAEVQKEMKISGSFDSLQWFVVKDYQLISSIINPDDVAAILEVNFPPINYTFIKLEINDSHSAPVNIIKAGYYQTVAAQGDYSPLRAQWMKTDSAMRKMSFLSLQWPEVYDVDAMEVKVKYPEHFLRQATLYSLWYQGGDQYTKKYIGELTLSSATSCRFPLEDIRTSRLMLEIRNGDDAPLKFESAEVFQHNHYCIAKLEKNKNYELRFGNALIDFPGYDLKYFEKIIPLGLKIIRPVSVSEVLSDKATHEKTMDRFSDKRIIWAILILVVLLLGFVTYRMMREMK